MKMPSLSRVPLVGLCLVSMRTQNFFDQNPMSQNALLTALREKYGKETLTNDRGDSLFVYWSANFRTTSTQPRPPTSRAAVLSHGLP